MATSATKVAAIVILAVVVCGVAVGGGFGIGTLVFKDTTSAPSNATHPPTTPSGGNPTTSPQSSSTTQKLIVE